MKERGLCFWFFFARAASLLRRPSQAHKWEVKSCSQCCKIIPRTLDTWPWCKNEVHVIQLMSRLLVSKFLSDNRIYFAQEAISASKPAKMNIPQAQYNKQTVYGGFYCTRHSKVSEFIIIIVYNCTENGNVFPDIMSDFKQAVKNINIYKSQEFPVLPNS